MSHALLYIVPSLDDPSIPNVVKVPATDVEHFTEDAFTITNARTLTVRAHRKGVTGSGRLFLIASGSFTLEAQNALLKLFEEPPTGVFFHIVIPNEEVLIPTLRSRCIVVAKVSENQSREALEAFMALSLSDRMEVIAHETKQKNKAWIHTICTESEHYASEQLKSGYCDLAKKILYMQSVRRMQGASQKMLLEELALTLPVHR